MKKFNIFFHAFFLWTHVSMFFKREFITGKTFSQPYCCPQVFKVKTTFSNDFIKEERHTNIYIVPVVRMKNYWLLRRIFFWIIEISYRRLGRQRRKKFQRRRSWSSRQHGRLSRTSENRLPRHSHIRQQRATGREEERFANCGRILI